MPDANSGIGTHRQEHHERKEQPKQPGATGEGREEGATPEEAMKEAAHKFGKTGQHVSDDR